jgi:predicted GNAT family acetyltransferase
MSPVVTKILQPGDEPALEAFLLPRVTSSMFLLGNMRTAGLRDTSRPYSGTYAARLEEGRIVGVVAHYWNGMLIVQAPGCAHPLWQAAVRSSERRIAGLIGPNDQVTAVKGALAIEEADTQMDETEILYALALDALVVPAALREGRVTGRRIERRDLDALTAWCVAYNVEAIGAEESPELWEGRRDSLERALEQGDTWVLEREGEPVAMSGFNTAIEEAVQVGGVYTPPRLRRRGYGRCVVAASLLDARAEGASQAILFTGRENLPAQRAYEALGFEAVGDYRIVILRDPIPAP